MNSINKKIIVPLLLCFISTTAMAHIVIDSNYYLRYIKDQGWTIYFNTKTSSLSKRIQELNPDLKGTNLNSTTFKQATFNYLEESISIKRKKGETYNLKGFQINFNGRLVNGHS